MSTKIDVEMWEEEGGIEGGCRVPWKLGDLRGKDELEILGIRGLRKNGMNI